MVNHIWRYTVKAILRNRFIVLAVILGITVFLGYKAQQIDILYEYTQLLPDDHPVSIDYKNFKKLFGQDGAVLVAGCDDPKLFDKDRFGDLYDLSQDIKKIQGIQEVVSPARIYRILKNDSLQRFDFQPVLTHRPSTQQEADSLGKIISELPFYDNIIFSKENKSYVIAITFQKKELTSVKRIAIVDSIKAKVDHYAKKYSIPVHYSGLPYIRSVVSMKIKDEVVRFLALGLIITSLILLIFFRSFTAVFFSLIVVCVSVIWSFGSIVLLGYKITVLSGLIPPLIIIIGVPNCIMLLNKYQFEYSRHQNKALALTRMIEHVGVSLFFANVTTSIGFAVFMLINTQILFEFGLVASLNIMATYLLSIHFIPVVFSFLPPPSVKHTRHLEGKRLNFILNTIDHWVHHYRRRIYAVVAIVFGIAVFGITKIRTIGYMVDDLPKDDPVYLDMKYFEKHFHGVMPFEISIDTRREGAALSDNTLRKINRLQKLLGTYKEFSRPVSVVEAVKFSNQAFHDGKPKHYILPNSLDLGKIAEYGSDAKSKQSYFKSFLDSTRRYTRVSAQMADVGSVRMDKLVKELKPRVDSIFNYDLENKAWVSDSARYEVVLTGNSLMFLKGNDFLAGNLVESVGIAIILIALVMMLLFASPIMIIISNIPSLIPLLFTAGLMGFFAIPLKPSTILIFSIAFGIASDGTLYFLTKYKQELRKHQWSISKTVSFTLKETGVSMIYIAVILASGFSLFATSGFGGTRALGILIPVTLLIAYCSNLVLLPSFLLSLEKRITKKAFMAEPLIEMYDEEEDIALDNLQIQEKEDARKDE